MNWRFIEQQIRRSARWLKTSPTGKAVRSWAEFLGKLTVVAGILGFILEAPQRAKQRHYQAWQLINLAGTSRADAGRRIAIRDLINDHVEMAWIDLRGAFLGDMDFRSARMPFSDFTDAGIAKADFSCRAGLYVSEYWTPSFSFCWVTVLHDARFWTEVDGVKFTRADMKRASLGYTPTSEQRGWLSSGMTIPPPTAEVRSIHDSTFDDANMEQSFFVNAGLSRNSFKHTKMSGVTLFNVNIGGANSFAGADLSDARFYGVTFIRNIAEKASDFTDTDLPKLQFGEANASESDFPQGGTILCRTRFSSGLSNRDCALAKP
jgi:uncharacterized protein YjbI with pentapeptide repeats